MAHSEEIDHGRDRVARRGPELGRVPGRDLAALAVEVTRHGAGRREARSAEVRVSEQIDARGGTMK
jgi:hypothetical protein